VDDSGMSRWGWSSTIYELCDNQIWKIDDVTERNIIEVLNWLSYNKEKTDLRIKQENNFR